MSVDLPVMFMGQDESKTKRFVRVPWALPNFVCNGCGHKWEKPKDVVIGD